MNFSYDALKLIKVNTSPKQLQPGTGYPLIYELHQRLIVFRYGKIVKKKKRERERKGRDPTQSCDKSPYTHRKVQKAKWQHKNTTKTFDYATIADRLRTVNSGNDSHPTGVVKPVYGIPTFPLTAKAV